MKKKLLLSCVAVTGLLMFACNNAPEGDQAEITDKQEVTAITGETFNVDTSASYVDFTGYGVGKKHPGRFKLNSGTVALQDGKVSGGTFDISIKSMDMQEEGEAFDGKLRTHLLSGDFFDADKFGNAVFQITAVAPYTSDGKDTSVVDGANFQVSGNLTLKGTTKNVRFPARIDLDGNHLKAAANFDIDRREWQMNYGNDKTLGDKFISERVNIELDIKAEVKRGS